jgi:hypothetical protein
MTTKHLSIPGFREVPQTGVIHVMNEAAKKGYKQNDLAWANLGQGAPEVGAFSSSSTRIKQIAVEESLYEYSPVSGQKELRTKVADLYNELFRKKKKSKYTFENVSICGGGRLALTRLAATLGNINIGHFLPDYTAYEELLSIFKAFVPIPILTENSHVITPDQIKDKVIGLGLQALLISNPCNPTGQVLAGDALSETVNIMRQCGCAFIIDEFYSHYIYSKPSTNDASPNIVSSAEFVEDVNNDPILIIDGFTKNWRYPGWRLSWTLGPKEVIKSIESAGSFLDGGASNLLQKEAMKLLDPKFVLQEVQLLQDCFLQKRNYALKRLLSMGINVEAEPEGTFYIWANLTDLPPDLNDGYRFFEAGLDEKVITVPGVFFDVNPEKRRTNARFQQYVRISFGPEMSILKQGLDSLENLIKKYR